MVERIRGNRPPQGPGGKGPRSGRGDAGARPGTRPGARPGVRPGATGPRAQEMARPRSNPVPSPARPQPVMVRAQHDDGQDRELHVAGRRAVLEALRSGRTINHLYIDQVTPAAAFAAIFEAANQRGLHAEAVPRQRLAMLAGEHHQGVVAICAPIAYVDIDDLLAHVRGAKVPALLLALDGVQDPQNIGSLIRTAEVAGAQGLLLAERRSGAVTAAVVRAAAGAALHLPVARVKNLNQAIDRLQREGIQAVVAHPVAERMVYDVDLAAPTVIVVGGEGKGVSELLRKRADAVVRLPQVGQIGSLNAAVAGAVMLYEAVRQRLATGACP